MSTFNNIKSPKYQKYLEGVEQRKDERYTFAGFEEYADQMLAIYEEELEELYNYIDKHVNTVNALKMLKKYCETRASPEQVNATLLSGQLIIDPLKMKDLFEVYVLSHKLNEQVTELKTAVRELKVVKRRIINLKTRFL